MPSITPMTSNTDNAIRPRVAIRSAKGINIRSPCWMSLV